MLLKSRKSVKTIAAELDKSEEAIIKKIHRLGLEVVVSARSLKTTTLDLPKELPSIEEALKILAAALEKSGQGGLNKVEIQRLQIVATLSRTYKDLLADYINYREIEAKLVEMEAKYAALLKKSQGNAAKRDSA